MISQGAIGIISRKMTFFKEAQVSIGAVFRKMPGKDSVRDKCLFDFQHRDRKRPIPYS